MPTTPSIIPRSEDSSHWYYPDGRSCYEVPYADPSKGMRPTTLRDARKLGLLPSVTTILRVLHKPALVEWLISTACLSVLTAPKQPGEDLDAFVKRVLTTERQQDQEAQKARDLGTEIHASIELALTGVIPSDTMFPFVDPVLKLLATIGAVTASEKIVVGNGYAGKLDCLTESDCLTVVDFKSCKNLPDESWPEHELQLSAYAQGLGNTGSKRIQTANIYISTTEPGQCKLCLNEDWKDTFQNGFAPLVKHWQWANQYSP